MGLAGNGGVPLSGTVSLPKEAGPDHRVAAVLLLQGSGPTDRDGNQGPQFRPDLLRQLAQLLGAQGIASLRFDKRGMYANAATLPHSRTEWPGFFSWSAMVGDAGAAFDFLLQQPFVDASRVGVLGRSEGGLIALELAKRKLRIKALVLAATPGRPLGDVIQDQLTELLDRQHADAAQRRELLDADWRVRSQILETSVVPADVPVGLRALYPDYLGPYLQSVLALYPQTLIRDYAGPILVINGEADMQVRADLDAKRLGAALSSRGAASEIFTPAAVSHNLKPVARDNELGIEGELAEPVKQKLVSWLRTNLQQ